ncbi:conserved hypothetical protein [Leptospira interrogans serovar Manilae]|uniref:Uncharacterized protein n=1 Tax=Leptospira interrogans serovar Manilae TaxID=214675 RepID=A0AAQ1NWG8_LEPIR|nr:conserved hypothetical protein [Leptospira interrogans serovar Manilae]
MNWIQEIHIIKPNFSVKNKMWELPQIQILQLVFENVGTTIRNL